MAKLRDFTPDKRNVNRGTAKGQKMIVRSIQEDGFGRSVLADKNGNLIAGNKTLDASAEVFGIDVEPIVVKTDGTRPVVVQRTDLDLDDPHGAARRLAYRDNLSSHFSFDLDPAQVMADIEAGFDFEAIDVGLADLGEMLGKAADELLNGNNAGADTEPQIDKAEELRQKWGVESGQMWQLGEHRIICGDCTDAAIVARVMGGEKADAVVTDVPYGISQQSNGLRVLDYGEWDKGAAKDTAYKAIKMCSDIPTITAFCSDDQLSHFWDMFSDRSRRSLCWLKPNPTVINGDNLFLPALEFAFYGKLKGAFFGGHCEKSYWEGVTPKGDDRVHPTQKPVGLIEWVIGLTAQKKCIVYEPFSGSGTTIIACENLSRCARAIEIDAGYVAVALQRWVDHTGKTPVKLGES